ncbi:MAG: Glu-tRNA(Gln) amidotransferase subunit GatE [Candidatus Pacearchaeota archaeon]
MEREIKVRIGLEIHQQLDTHKLFCHCPSLTKENIKPDLIVKRNLFATFSELGEIDVAALYEQEKSKNNFYYFYKDCCCLVELDEMPPFPINEEALKIAIQISLLLKAKLLNLTQVMRKIVVDGSDVSGFQRTLLLARNGELEYLLDNEKKEIRIQTICLEEEAAKKIKEEGNNIYWSLDRYGIPLVEIATEPTIQSPEEAKVVALAIGEILRSCKVKRGIGTIRQDLNVSVEGGARTEIKGVQEPRLIPIVLQNEIEYQLERIKKKEKLHPVVKKAESDGSLTFLRPLPGSARMYPETDISLIKINNILEQAKRELPRSISEIKMQLLTQLESDDLVSGLVKSSEKLKLFEEFEGLKEIKESKEIKKFIADLLVNVLRGISRDLKISEPELLSKVRGILHQLVLAFVNKKITKQAVALGIVDYLNGANYEEIIKKYSLISRERLEEEIKKLAKEVEKKYLMQEAIKRFKLRADVKDIIKIVNEVLIKK